MNFKQKFASKTTAFGGLPSPKKSYVFKFYQNIFNPNQKDFNGFLLYYSYIFTTKIALSFLNRIFF